MITRDDLNWWLDLETELDADVSAASLSAATQLGRPQTRIGRFVATVIE